MREKQIEADHARWRRAEGTRANAKATLDALGDGDAVTDEKQSVREWMRWVLDFADRIDPLRESDD